MSRLAAKSGSRGFFGIGIYGSKTPANLGTLWRSANLYGASFIYTVSARYEPHHCTDTMKTPKHVPFLSYTDIDDLIEHLPHATPLVGVELDDTAHPLGGYGHRERACYMLGAEDFGLPPKVVSRCHELIQIETPAPWSMNVAAAGSIILHDRHVKSGVNREQ